MSMYNLIEYSDNCSKISGTLWQYCRDELVLDDDNAIADFNVYNATTGSFKIREKITGQAGKNGTENIEIKVPLKYLSKF